jgi:hypothetical protein
MEENERSFEDLMEALRQRLFHFSNEEARPIIDDFIQNHPILLSIHDHDWYYENL